MVVMGGEVFADAPPTELPGSGRACHWNGRTSVGHIEGTAGEANESSAPRSEALTR